MKFNCKFIVILLSPLWFTSCVSSGPPQPSKEALAAAKPYPLNTCLVIDRPLSETPKTYTKIYKGQQVKFCCLYCVKAFEANPEAFIHKVQ